MKRALRGLGCLFSVILGACASSGQTAGVTSAVSTRSSCGARESRFNARQIVCGLELDAPAAMLCSDSALKPRPRSSIVGASVMFAMSDSSVLIAAAPIARTPAGDSVKADGTIPVSACDVPLQLVSREWRFKQRPVAIALFREARAGLQASSDGLFRECILEATGPAPTERNLYALGNTKGRSQTLTLSVGEREPKWNGNYLEFALRKWTADSMVLTRNQRRVACDDALDDIAAGR